MNTLIIVGSLLAVIGLLIFFFGRSKEKLGGLKEKSKSQQGALDIRKDANEHKRETKGNSRRDFLDMGK